MLFLCYLGHLVVTNFFIEKEFNLQHPRFVIIISFHGENVDTLFVFNIGLQYKTAIICINQKITITTSISAYFLVSLSIKWIL